MTSKDEAPPQEVFFRFSGAGIFHGEVLDIGCGIGDNAIYITKHAKDVHITAIDMVPKAIEVAREKAQKNNVNIQFEVVNMLEDLSKTNLKQHSYDIILEYLMKPGGLYIQLCFSEKETREGGPRRVKKSDLNELFSSINGWTIESIEDTIYDSRPDAPLGMDGRAYFSLIRRNNIKNK